MGFRLNDFWRNHSEYSVLHAKPSGFAGTGTYGAICCPAFFHSIYRRTNLYRPGIERLAFIQRLKLWVFQLTVIKNGGIQDSMYLNFIFSITFGIFISMGHTSRQPPECMHSMDLSYFFIVIADHMIPVGPVYGLSPKSFP